MPDSFRSGGPGHLPATLFSGALHFGLTSGIPCPPAIHSSSALNLIHSSPPSPPSRPRSSPSSGSWHCSPHPSTPPQTDIRGRPTVTSHLVLSQTPSLCRTESVSWLFSHLRNVQGRDCDSVPLAAPGNWGF